MKYTNMYTRHGDTGYTCDASGNRISKGSDLILLLTLLDKMCASIGMCHCCVSEDDRESLIYIQQSLLDVGSDLASNQYFFTLETYDWLNTELNSLAEHLQSEYEEITDWIIYGTGSKESAQLFFTTTVIREFESNLIRYRDDNPQETINSSIVMYLNALSKYFYMLAIAYS